MAPFDERRACLSVVVPCKFALQGLDWPHKTNGTQFVPNALPVRPFGFWAKVRPAEGPLAFRFPTHEREASTG